MDGSASYELVQADQLVMTAGTYSYPDSRTPFDERNPEAVKSMLREELRARAERDEAVRRGEKTRRRESVGAQGSDPGRRGGQ